jgi:hypothetical protein
VQKSFKKSEGLVKMPTAFFQQTHGWKKPILGTHTQTLNSLQLKSLKTMSVRATYFKSGICTMWPFTKQKFLSIFVVSITG